MDTTVCGPQAPAVIRVSGKALRPRSVSSAEVSTHSSTTYISITFPDNAGAMCSGGFWRPGMERKLVVKAK